MENANLNEVSRISAGTVFKGEIIANGDIRIDGKFEGRLNSRGRLVAGESAQVNGDVICQNVDFSGKMGKGTMYVADTLSLNSGCVVNGDIHYKRLQVELDAKVNGSLKTLDEAEFNKLANQVGPAAAHPSAKSAEKPAPAEKKENELN